MIKYFIIKSMKYMKNLCDTLIKSYFLVHKIYVFIAILYHSIVIVF